MNPGMEFRHFACWEAPRSRLRRRLGARPRSAGRGVPGIAWAVNGELCVTRSVSARRCGVVGLVLPSKPTWAWWPDPLGLIHFHFGRAQDRADGRNGLQTDASHWSSGTDANAHVRVWTPQAKCLRPKKGWSHRASSGKAGVAVAS